MTENNNGNLLVLMEAVDRKDWGITIQKMFRSNHIGI